MGAAPHLKPYHFKKGQSGNPHGRPAIPHHLKDIKSLSDREVNKLVSKYGRMTYGELREAINSDTIPVIDLAIATIFDKSIENADHQKLNFLLDRAIGKAKDIDPDDDDDVAAEVRKLTIQELVSAVRAKVPGLNE